MSAHTTKSHVLKSKNLMARAFGIITAIVLGLSAFLAFKNKGKYEQEITDRKSEQEKLVKSKDALTQVKENLADTTAKRTETEEQVKAFNDQKTKLTAANEKFKADIAANESNVAADKAKLDAIKEQLEGVGSIENLVAEVKSINSQIEELNQTVASAEASLANLTAESGRLDQVIDNFRSISALYPAKKSDPSLKARISGTYPNWGFVTLSAGNSSGVITNSTLEVVRGGETIAKLLVTAAEGNSASASIVPDSLKADTTLQVGDTVVAAK